jgi:hypothetical protein
MKTVLHIGCERTGTTSLQQQVFNDFDSVLYLGRHGYRPGLLQYTSTGKNISDGKERLSSVIKNTDDEIDTVLYSHEAISASHLSEQKEIAKRYKRLFNDAEILITVRRQQDISVSRYVHRTVSGYEEDFKDYMERGLSNLDHDYRNHRMDSYHISWDQDPADLWSVWQFDKLMNIWGDHFADVHIIPLEAWNEQPVLVKKTISKLLEVDEGTVRLPSEKSATREEKYVRSVLPSLVPETLKSKASSLAFFGNRVRDDKNVNLTDDQIARINQVYSHGNDVLSERTAFDLSQLEYPSER